MLDLKKLLLTPVIFMVKCFEVLSKNILFEKVILSCSLPSNTDSLSSCKHIEKKLSYILFLVSVKKLENVFRGVVLALVMSSFFSRPCLYFCVYNNKCYNQLLCLTLSLARIT